MEKISGLSEDELLVKILSFLPTKVAVSTSVLSRRWEHLWKRVPKLDFAYTDAKPSDKCQKRLHRFIQRNLPLHRAPVLESLRLKLSFPSFIPDDIEAWTDVAVSRGVRELSISYSSADGYITRLPDSLYTCESLVSLKLDDRLYVDSC
ncbi:unnamed protein product [Microthlaspi erraticum]|uniref:F-box domain-containing protein n=1 Tax=Microthlaspi erraticum TaxID=1685480 RepID=A0A6D2LPY2_9BRAS|nr:unnamed protein product [Microthlaspi erraticum]